MSDILNTIKNVALGRTGKFAPEEEKTTEAIAAPVTTTALLVGELPTEEYVAPVPMQEVETTVTKGNSTPVVERLMSTQDQLAAAQQQTLENQKGNVDKDLAIEQEFAEKRLKLEADYNKDLQLTQDQNKREYDSALSAIAAKTKELEQTKPSTFWQRADTSDKIGMSLALLVGGLGQGLSGGQTNAAVTAMNKAVDQDLDMQYKDIDNKLKLLDRSSLSLTEKERRQNALIGEKAARFNASMNMVNNQMESAKLGVKSADIKNKIDLAINDNKMKQNQFNLDFQRELAGKTVETTKKMTAQEMAHSAAGEQIYGVGKVPATLSVKNPDPDSVATLSKVRDDAEKLEQLDKEMSSNAFKAVGKINEAILAKENSKFGGGAVGALAGGAAGAVGGGLVGLLGGPIGALAGAGAGLAGGVTLGSNAAQYLANTKSTLDIAKDTVKNDSSLSPKEKAQAVEYYTRAARYTAFRIRDESGASIADPEFQRRFGDSFSLSTSPTSDDVLNKTMFRRSDIKALKTLSKDSSPAWWQKESKGSAK